MLSFVSALSVNLIASIAGATVDSSRVVAVSANAPEVRVMPTGGSPVAASPERTILRTASRYLGTRYRFGGTRPGAHAPCLLSRLATLPTLPEDLRA